MYKLKYVIVNIGKLKYENIMCDSALAKFFIFFKERNVKFFKNMF